MSSTRYMLGRFVCARVRVMTAAPLPGVSPPRFGSRAPVGRACKVPPAAPKPGLNHLARRAMPARRRTTNELEAVDTDDPLLAGCTLGPDYIARELGHI